MYYVDNVGKMSVGRNIGPSECIKYHSKFEERMAEMINNSNRACFVGFFRYNISIIITSEAIKRRVMYLFETPTAYAPPLVVRGSYSAL